MSPRRFTEKPLAEVLAFKNGKSIGPGGTGGFPVYGSNGIIGGSDEYREENGIILGRVGAYCGSVAYEPGKFWASDNTIVVYPSSSSHDVRFLSYLLRHLNLNRWAGGAAQPLLTQTVLKQVRAPVPDYCAQRRIASILSAYDDLIENNTRRIAILEEMARALYRDWFVHFRFPASAQATAGRPGHEKVKLVDSPLGKIPERWPLEPASHVIEIDPMTTVAKQGVNPFVPMAALSTQTMLIDQIEHRSGNSGSKFRSGDTLFARITPCLENGKTGFVNFLDSEGGVAFGSTEFIVMRSKTVCPEYVYLLARSEAFRDHAIKSMSGATGRQRVRTDCFNKFYVAEPERAVLDAFQKLVGPMFAAIKVLATKNANLRTTRDLLLPKLISGEIDVSALDMAAQEATA